MADFLDSEAEESEVCCKEFLFAQELYGYKNTSIPPCIFWRSE
jgi:hypothetical protein